jgi:hypothetical protein
MPTIDLLGSAHPWTLPERFTERDELAHAIATHRPRGAAACLGLCCPDLVPDGPARYAAARYDALEFGGLVYADLRQRGASPAEIITAGVEIANALILALYPRAAEVEQAEDFTAADAAPSTAPRSA